MIKKFTLLFIVILNLSLTDIFAQGGNPPQYPYAQNFDTLIPFQTIEGQAGWLNGDFFGVNPSAVSVYSNRGIAGSQSMTMELNDNFPTDSIITPLIGSLGAGAYISFYYRIVNANNQAVSLTGNGGFKFQMKQDIAFNWIAIDSISASNHIDTSEFRKITYTLPMDSVNVNFRFSFYQGTPGQEIFIDIDSLVVTDTALTVTNVFTMNANNTLIQNNELNQITVKCTDAAAMNSSLNIFDLNGKIVYASVIQTSTSIDAANWSKGVYFVQVTNNREIINKKIIVR